MKVALKFCGGCNPAYDRVEYWEQIRRKAGDKIDWVTLDYGNYDAVLLISGCDCACPRDDIPQMDRGVTPTNDSLNVEEVMSLLEECLKTKDGDGSEPCEKGVSHS